MNKLVCIFPEDETTFFLKPLYNLLKSSENIDCYSFNTYEDEVLNMKLKSELEELEKESFFIFLGHGASHSVYGSPIKDSRTTFLTKEEIDKYECQLCFISCRSADLLNKKGNSIGFGNIPTDYEMDVLAMREHDVNYLSGINVNDIENFKKIFIEVLRSSFILWFSFKELSLFKLNSFFRLFINKKICELLLSKDVNNYRGIANILYELKEELSFIES